LGLALLAFTPNQPSAFAVGILVGLGSIMFMTAATAITQLAADPMMRGRILALQAIVFLGSTPIGGPIVGAIAERFGARYGIALGAVATLTAAGIGFYTIRRSQLVEARDAAPIPLQADVPGDVALFDPLIAPRAS
jgi:MFS family permease